jgi:hypothetical protein
MRQKTVLVFGLALAAVFGLALPAWAGSVTGALTPGTHTVQFGGAAPTFAHQDSFATTSVTPAGAPGDPATAITVGPVVFNDVNGNGSFDVGTDTVLRVTIANTSILYGGGEATFTVDGSGIVTSNELTFAFGNLFETTSQVHPGGAGEDTVTVAGGVGLIDSLTGVAGVGAGAEISDSNGDTLIQFGSLIDLDGVYGDYNRDGVVDAADRPFLAVWESDPALGGIDYLPQQSPSTDADADLAPGVTVDNLWVGDPWTGPVGSPVDIVNAGLEANATAEADPGLTDDSYGKLLALFALDTALPAGALPMATVTTINTVNPNLPAGSGVDISGVNPVSGLPQPGTVATVELVGGRLLDLLTVGSNTFFTLSGHYQFDPLDGSSFLSFLEFSNTPTLRGTITVIPEPTTLALFLTSAAGLAGIRLRRRRHRK